MQEHFPARAARREGCDQLVSEPERSADLPGGGEVVDLRERTPARAVAVVARRETETVARELGGEVGRAACARPLRGVLEQPSELVVGIVRGQGEVARAHVGVDSSGGEVPVQRPSGERAHPAVGRRRDEGMGKTHLQLLVDDEQALPLGRDEEALDVQAGQGIAELPGGQRPCGRGQIEQLGELAGHRAEAAGDRRLERVGEAKLACGETRPLVAREPAGQLDRVERVAARDLVDAREQRVGDRLDRSAQHAAEDSEADRTEVERVATARRKRARNRQRILRIGAGSNGLEHADGLAVEPAQRVAQGSCGGRVEPLHVVDRQHHGPARGELPERLQDRPSAGELVVLRFERGRLELDAVEQVGKPREGERHLLLGGPREHGLESRSSAAVDRAAPK